LAILNSCSNSYDLLSQDKLAVSPCGKSETGVNVRIRNLGKITFSKFELEIPGQKLTFSGLRGGELSCYKNISSIWTNNSYKAMITKAGYTVTLLAVGTDHVGESDIKHGDVTIEVVIKKTKKGFDSNLHFNIESD